MTATPIHDLVWLAIAAVLLGTGLWLRDWWRGADLPDLRCACGHKVSTHILSDNVNDLEPCTACRCPHWATEDASRARGVAVPRDHGITDEAPLYDPAVIDRELRELLDGAA